MILRSRIIQPKVVKMATEISKESLLTEIDNKTKAMLNLGKQLVAINPNLEPFDLMLLSIVNRTVNLNSAFTNLIRSNNFIAGAPLVRINLDSLLRLYASIISEHDRNTFAKEVRKGVKISTMKLQGTKTAMRDMTLVKELSKIEGMDWVQKVYDAGNSFVHFDNVILFSSQKIASYEERTFIQTIGLHDSFIPESEKFGAVVWMNKIIDSIIQQCQIWMFEKCERYNFNIEDLNNIH